MMMVMTGRHSGTAIHFYWTAWYHIQKKGIFIVTTKKNSNLTTQTFSIPLV